MRIPICFDFILFEHEKYILRDNKTEAVLFWFELAMDNIAVVEVQKKIRRSFTREFKLSAVEWYYNVDKNILQTANKF